MRELLQRTEREKAQLQTQNRDMERQQEELKRRQLEEDSNRKEFAHPIVSPRMRPLRSEDDPQSEMGVWPNNHMTSIKRDFSALNHKVKELEGRLETEQDQRQKLVNSYNKVRIYVHTYVCVYLRITMSVLTYVVWACGTYVLSLTSIVLTVVSHIL